MCKKNFKFILNGLLFISFILFIQTGKAQIITLPDPNFANALETSPFNSCVTGNQLDVSCVQSHISSGDTILYLSWGAGITDLTGIEYFNGLHQLVSENNPIAIIDSLPTDLDSIVITSGQLTSLPTLPSNLRALNVVGNQLTVLPALPNGIKYLNVSANQLTGLPVLPASLKTLYATGNLLTSLPALPPNLIYLSCSGSFSSLPALPVGLEQLSCSSDLLTGLPTLPDSLLYLNCSHCSLASLPALPSQLIQLNCQYNELTTVPALPNSLYYIDCSHNNIHTLPVFTGTNMYQVDFSYNQLTSINEHPVANGWNEAYFSVAHNMITSLPVFTTNMNSFDCSYNQLTNLPLFTSGEISSFSCSHNFITSMVNYPLGCENFDASFNQLSSIAPFDSSVYNYILHHNLLTSLPPFLDVMGRIYVQSNLLTYVDTLPSYMMGFSADSNQISCLPVVNAINEAVSFSGNPFTCVPSLGYPMYSPPASNYPLCFPGNPNGCNAAYNVTGSLFFDSNNNCVLDSNDTVGPNIPVKIYQGAMLIETVIPMQGVFMFDLDPGTYHLVVDTTGCPFPVSCPFAPVDTVITVTGAFITGLNFGFECVPAIDVRCHSITMSGITFPGQTCVVRPLIAHEDYTWNSYCDTIIPGTVALTYSGPFTYTGAYPGSIIPASVIGNTISFNVPDLAIVTNFSFASYFETDTTAQIGDSLCIDIVINTPMPEDTGNNHYSHCFPTMNSYDPNIKMADQPSDLLYPFFEELVYTIHFQNTGNAPAINIYLTDMIDTDLDVSTFRLISSSHPVYTQLNGQSLQFNFPNIMLADSDSDEPASHGYVQYGIQPLTSFPVGTSFENTASIFFDFNSPIITNTTVNTIVAPNVGAGINTTVALNVYPNPTTDKLILNSDLLLEQITVSDTKGNICINIQGHSNIEEIDLGHLSAGLYFVSVQTAGGNSVKKVMVRK